MSTALLFLGTSLIPIPASYESPALPAATPAQEVESAGPTGSFFDYRYVEAAVLLGDLDGVRVGGSVPLRGPWIGLGRLEYLGADAGPVDVDILLLSVGAGYVHTLEDDLDFVGSAELQFGEADADGADDDDFGVRVRGGVRYQATQELELAGGISVATIFDEDLGANGTALYAFEENLSGFVGFDVRDESSALIGVRFDL